MERIRRLVLLSDERDLRQLPAAAQGIDAVRLMTMHGSKGLEFGVVHIPGLNDGSLPRSPNASIAKGITPPNGMIEGATGNGHDAIHAALTEEQECLFFVALSRARDRLLLYCPLKAKNGRSRKRSSFIDRIGHRITSKHVRPTKVLPLSEEVAPVNLTIEGSFTFSDHQLGLYQRCPRRFLYTHVLEVGGRRTETAFMKLHVAVRKVVDSIAEVSGEPLSLSRFESVLDGSWDEHGPADHGYSREYKIIAYELIRFLAGVVECEKAVTIPELRLPVPGGEIVISPDHVSRDDRGGVVMRRVDTGHKGSTDDDSLATAAFHLAANSHSPGCTVELVHLADGAVTPVSMTQRVLQNRRDSIAEVGRNVASGLFPIIESITCPRCPAFFICGSLPAGPVRKNLSK
jgi:hypothetical protein